jgi:hypothetical protein
MPAHRQEEQKIPKQSMSQDWKETFLQMVSGFRQYWLMNQEKTRIAACLRRTVSPTGCSARFAAELHLPGNGNMNQGARIVSVPPVQIKGPEEKRYLLFP